MWKVHTFENDLWKCGTGCRHDRNWPDDPHGGISRRKMKRMDGKMRVIDYVKEVGEYIQTQMAGSQLPRCLKISCLMGQCSGHLIEKLSGGERRRLFLLRVLMSSPNVFDPG